MAVDTSTLVSKIKDFVTDAFTLDVLTLTGDIKLIADNFNQAEQNFSWDAVLENVAKQMKPVTGSQLEIVAFTHVEWDKDSVNFVRKDLTDEQKTLVAFHNSAVEAAQKSRLEAVKLVGDLLKIEFK